MRRVTLASRRVFSRLGASLSTLVRAGHNRLHDRRDTDFVLHELLGIEVDRADADAIVNSCESFCDAWHPLIVAAGSTA